MENFLLSWVLGNLAWKIAGMIVGRLWFWFSGKSLERKRELAYWCISFVTLTVLFRLWSAPPEVSDFSRSSIYGISIGSPGPANRAGMMIAVDLRNTGSDSSLELQSAKLPLTNGTTVLGIAEHYTTFTFERQEGLPSIVINASELMTNREPIKRGFLVRRFALFRFDNVTSEEARRAGNKVTLEFVDTFGRLYRLTKSFDGRWQL
jgi:hypothetical protein